MQDAPLSRIRCVQENRQMRFEEAFQGWKGGRLTQAEAALLLGQCERSIRRHIERYEADGMDGLLDRRLNQVSKRRAGPVEVEQVVQSYKTGFAGWNVSHFHSKYRTELGGTRSYSGVKTVLQGGRRDQAGATAGTAPHQARARALAGDDDSPGCQHPLLGTRAAVGPGSHDGRRHR